MNNTVVRKIKRKRPGIRRSRFLFSEDPLNKVNEMSNDIFVSASDMAEYMIQAVLKKRNDKQLESVRKDFGVYATHKEWDAYITHLSDYRCVQDSRTTGYFHDDENLSYLAYRIHNTHVSIELFGDDVFIDNLHKQFQNDFTFVTNQIEWIYSSDGSSMEVPLQPDRMPLNEMYPFLEGQNLGEYYDNFMKSNASILLLIGPPGTGKTTFIRGLLQHTNSSAIVTYDASILEKDEVKQRMRRLCHAIGTSNLMQRHHTSLINIKTEYSLTIPIEDDFFCVIYDLLIENENGEWEIWDWKTNGCSTQEQMDILAERYTLQMRYYAYVLSLLKPGQFTYTTRLLFTNMIAKSADESEWTKTIKVDMVDMPRIYEEIRRHILQAKQAVLL